MLHLLSIIIGFFLDLLLGDPLWLPHPVCFIGRLIAFLEKHLRKLCGHTEGGLLLGGLLLVLVVVTLCFGIPALVLYATQQLSPYLCLAIETIFCYQIFATKCLQDESMKVYHELLRQDIVEARVKLSYIVGRDTQELNEEEVIKGAVETVAENTSDGVIAPMFYMFLGGAPLAMVYKGINTMDSMVGYKNDKYLYFGRCAAKLDDVANLIPARISGVVMILASFLAGFNGVGAWNIFWRDRYNHLSPNSAMTEAVTAGALNIQLGGDHFYFGKLVHKDTLGDAIRPAETEDIKRVNVLLYLTALLSLAIFTVIYISLNLYLFAV